MEIERSDSRLRHQRTAFKKRVEVTTPSGTKFEAQSKDISQSGIALTMSAPLIENGMFIQLHTEGLGNLSGTVARTYDGGAAVQFDDLLEEDPGPNSAPGMPAWVLNRLA